MGQKRMRLTFVAPPFAGHFNPLLVLAQAARDAGHDIDFITGPRKHPILNANGISAPTLASIGPDTLEAIANTKDRVGSNPIRLLKQFRQNLRLLPAIGAELAARWTRHRPDAVIADSVAPIAGLVAERLSIPWLTTIATPLSIETRKGTPSYCGGWTPGNPARDAAGRAAIRMFKHSVALLFRPEFAALGLTSLYRPDGAEAIYSPHAILGFGINELEFERDWPSPFEMVGPIVDAPESSPANAPMNRPRVIVTHGTHLLWAKRTLVDEIVELSKQLPHVDFVVSLGEPERAGDSPQESANHVTVQPFVDYSFKHYDAIIHHGGSGVTYAAILAGVPSLVVPRDYDQFDYAARIVHHQLGLRHSSLRDSAKLVSRLLDRAQWPALQRFQQYAKAYAPRARFLEILNRVVERT